MIIFNIYINLNMTDSWEDWENEDFEVPVLNVPTQEQLKRLEEQKLIEEADNELARELFITINKEEEERDLACVEPKQSEKAKIIPQKTQPPAKKKPEKAVNKQKENEEKQKAASKKLKEEKAKKIREEELFGDAEYDDTYADYEDQFY